MRAGGGSGEDWGDGVKCSSILGKTEGMIRWFSGRLSTGMSPPSGMLSFFLSCFIQMPVWGMNILSLETLLMW